VAIIDVSEPARVAQRKHGLFALPAAAASARAPERSPPVTGALLLGRMMAGTTALACMLKGEERVRGVLTFGRERNSRGGVGNVQAVVSESVRVGHVRGFVDFAEERGSADEDDPVAELRVTTVLHGTTTPIVDVVPLQSGDVTSEFDALCERSLQIPSAVALGSSLDVTNGSTELGELGSSGGILIQTLPDCPKEVFERARAKLHEFITNEDAIDRVVAATSDLRVIAERVLPSEEAASLQFYTMPYEGARPGVNSVAFFCGCSSASSLERLQAVAEAGTEVTCRYCSTTHVLK
jgi:redox-regulated HSP33 family molecular chaperone